MCTVVLPLTGPPAGDTECTPASHWAKTRWLLVKNGGSSATSSVYSSLGVRSAGRRAGVCKAPCIGDGIIGGGQPGGDIGGSDGASSPVGGGSGCGGAMPMAAAIGSQMGARALGGASQLISVELWNTAGTMTAELFVLICGANRQESIDLLAKLNPLT